MSDRDSELLELKNLGIATVNILNAIGVHSRHELQCMGPVQAYVRIKQRGIHVSKVMLYALQGALDDKHWNELSQETKDQLVQDADDLAAGESAAQ
ncbi:TfoX/Sxy family protein [uncultured Pseudoteredinibacter sp.]|uniref:TfoX/Sxy family protein n=1 Tax=uncultured Pseudoteredinibacter sp. TaxID=1641701 RepID=UPI0026259B2E|nr:TfoX/Sxy family protein [uncultured Pseudoteredinibacter sp.]